MPRRKCDFFPLRLLPMLGLGDVQYPSRNIHTTSQPTTNNNRDKDKEIDTQQYKARNLKQRK